MCITLDNLFAVLEALLAVWGVCVMVWYLVRWGLGL
jgi:hypothetical protein